MFWLNTSTSLFSLDSQRLCRPRVAVRLGLTGLAPVPFFCGCAAAVGHAANPRYSGYKDSTGQLLAEPVDLRNPLV